ncbi:MAG: ABC transporter substrate-binding protein [Actinomycetota bacterium]|nr:ABC transporter substrate-binding protein [Actinomycetota bacterium]
MPAMTSYRHGVPAWVDVSSPDVEATLDFYRSVFGWEATPDMGPDAGGYRFFLLHGQPVAGAGPLQDGPPSWTTYINVADLDDVAGHVAELGGALVVPPMDLPNDSGRCAFDFDPTGGFFGLFQAGANRFGAALVNEPGTVAWNELNVRDVSTATAFYDALIGWTTSAMDPGEMDGYKLVNVSGRPVAGVMAMGDDFPPEVPTNWTTYFAVADLADTVNRCTDAGGSVIMPAFDTPVGHPWTTGTWLSYATEAQLWGEWIEANLTDRLPVKVVGLVIANHFGRAFEQGIERFAAAHPDVVSEFVSVGHEPMDPSLADEMGVVAGEDPDVFIAMTVGNPCLPAVQEAMSNGLSGITRFVPSPCGDPMGFMVPAGEAAEGWLIARGAMKSSIDPAFAADPWVSFVNQTLTEAGLDVSVRFYGIEVNDGWVLVEILRVAAELEGG